MSDVRDRWTVSVIDTGQTGTLNDEVLSESVTAWPRIPVKGDVIDLRPKLPQPYRVGLVVFEHEARNIRVELA